MKPACSGLAAAEGALDSLVLVGEDNLPAIKLYAKMAFEKTVIRQLEGQLEEEWRAWGKRRVLMRKVWS